MSRGRDLAETGDNAVQVSNRRREGGRSAGREQPTAGQRSVQRMRAKTDPRRGATPINAGNDLPSVRAG